MKIWATSVWRSQRSLEFHEILLGGLLEGNFGNTYQVDLFTTTGRSEVSFGTDEQIKRW
jgi:hypothetical protein